MKLGTPVGFEYLDTKFPAIEILLRLNTIWTEESCITYTFINCQVNYSQSALLQFLGGAIATYQYTRK